MDYTPQTAQIDVDYDAVAIGQRIKDAREIRGLSQAQLGNIIGVSDAHISNMEKGKTKDTKVVLLMKIAKVLHQDFSRLLGIAQFSDTASRLAAAYDAEVNAARAAAKRELISELENK